MKISFNGKEQIDAPNDKVLKFLSNMQKVASCIPDSQNFKQVGEKKFTMDVTLSVAGISGTFSLEGSVEKATSSHFEYVLKGNGIGSTLKITLIIDISKSGANATNVSWGSEAELSGIVSGVSEPVLRKLSEDKIREVVKRTKLKIEKGK